MGTAKGQLTEEADGKKVNVWGLRQGAEESKDEEEGMNGRERERL